MTDNFDTVADDPAQSFERAWRGLVDEVHTLVGTLHAVAHRAESGLDYLETHTDISPAIAGSAYFYLRTAYEELDKAAKRVYRVQDSLNKRVVPERMRLYDMDGFRVPEIARSFSIVERTSASFVDRDTGMEWLRSIGQGDLIQETVNAGTLAAFCRNMLLETGEEPPEDTVKLSTYSTTSMTKYRPR